MKTTASSDRPLIHRFVLVMALSLKLTFCRYISFQGILRYQILSNSRPNPDDLTTVARLRSRLIGGNAHHIPSFKCFCYFVEITKYHGHKVSLAKPNSVSLACLITSSVESNLNSGTVGQSLFFVFIDLSTSRKISRFKEKYPKLCVYRQWRCLRL
jgi:hypothetical protein